MRHARRVSDPCLLPRTLRPSLSGPTCTGKTTRSYQLLKEFHQQFGAALEILIFPSDEFGAQELPSAEIPAFVQSKGLPVEAPGCHLMAKVAVNGPDADSIWSLAKSKFGGDVKWNFAGVFLFDKAGVPFSRSDGPPKAADIQALVEEEELF